MFSRSILLTLFFAATSFAQGPSSGGMERGNFVRVPDYKTTGASNWFVDSATGSDANNCQTANSPCATLLGVSSRLPAVLHDPVTITLANGSYAGGWFSDLHFDPTSASTGAYVVLVGSLVAYTPATGTATGTASSATQCVAATPPSSPASLTDTGQAWTTDNLRGQLIEITSGTGSGQFFPIQANTAQSVSIAGCWSVVPNATSTYAIRDWGAVINTGTNQPPDYITAAGNAVGLAVINMHDSERNNSSAFFFIDSVRISTSGTGGALRVSNADVYARRSRFDSASTAGAAATLVGAGRTVFVGNVFTNSSTGIVLNTAGPSGAPYNASALSAVRVFSSYFQSASSGSSPGMLLTTPGIEFNGVVLRMTSSTVQAAVRFVGTVTGGNFQNTNVYCAAGGTSIGLQALNATQSNPAIGSNTLSILWDSSSINECATAVSFDGRMQSLQTDDSTFQATAGTTALSFSNGAYLNLDVNSAVSGAFTNQISLDNGLVTADFADVASSRVISTPNTHTTVLSVP